MAIPGEETEHVAERLKERAEGPGAPLIRECCEELGDDPKDVRIRYELFDYKVVRPGSCIARFGRKLVDDKDKEAIKEALLELREAQNVGAASRLPRPLDS